jgi:hypothetical protein
MEQSEIRDYVIFRLEQAGWAGDPAFSDQAFSEIYHHTGGIPRRINVLCARLLLHASLDERHAVTADDVSEVAEELMAETAPISGGETLRNPVGLPAGLAGRATDLVSDLEARLCALEERMRRHDLAFRRALLGLSDCISEISLGTRKKS